MTQSVHSPGLDVLFYHYRYVYFHDGIKSSSHGSGSCSDRCYDLCNKQDRWKQRQIFCQPQMSLADVTGFVEERMNGQRVVKVFNHEGKSEEEFDTLNEALFESASKAHTFANMMGPVIGNIGNLQFVLTAVLGGLSPVLGVGGITLGVMASYLQFTKSFTQPFMQVAQQFNAIVMALAGAERIFNLMTRNRKKTKAMLPLSMPKRMKTEIL